MTEIAVSRTADAVADYLHFWNAEPAEQRRIGPEIFTDEVAYIAPIGVSRGVAAMVEFTEQFLAEAGGYEYRTRSDPDHHNARARVAWELRVDGATFAEGTDVLTVDDDGRISSITTFLDRPPQGFPHDD